MIKIIDKWVYRNSNKPSQYVRVKNPPKTLDINVKIGSKYIRYQLKEETDSPLVSFEHIYKVVKRQDYLYLFINRYSIIVLKLESIEQKEQLLKMLKERYLSRKAYFENK